MHFADTFSFLDVINASKSAINFGPTWSTDENFSDIFAGYREGAHMGLVDLSFIERAENIVFIGKPGNGKTGFTIGLLRQALIDYYRGHYYNSQDLFDELYDSLADGTTAKFIKKHCNYPI